MKHLILSVKRSFNTFRMQLRKFNQKTGTIAKAIRVWKAKKQLLLADLYTAWTDWETARIEEIQKAHPHRPTGEVSRIVEEELVVPEPALRHRCLKELYALERKRFHIEFSQWHKEKTDITLQIASVKKRALVCKLDMEAKRRAREQLRNDGGPIDNGINESLASVVEELSDLLNERDTLLGLEPRFDPSPSEKNIKILLEIAKRLKREASVQSRKSSVASLSNFKRGSLRVQTFGGEENTSFLKGRNSSPGGLIRNVSEAETPSSRRVSRQTEEPDFSSRSWLRKASVSSKGRLNSLRKRPSEKRDSPRTQQKDSRRISSHLTEAPLFSPSFLDNAVPDSGSGRVLPPIMHKKPSLSRLHR
eukprot:TRINITY_DN955_c0_g1_i4.p2 TRINITY_DN955_c0_g1~~TRINITY_DN955_c0_g1_i4.p2  ORF type:complete len:362 (+),score=45.83 TRINITY_DN955_c0_g1_i4:1838-2923(+)